MIKIADKYKDNKKIADFFEQLPAAFDEGGELIFKGRNVIKSYVVDGTDIIVKRFKRPSFLQKIVYSFFKGNKALRAFQNGQELLKRGIDTPEPIAYVDTWSNGLLQSCFYACGRNDNPDIKTVLDKDDWDKDIAKAFAHFSAQLHERGILHLDLNITNVLFNPQTLQFSVIDINRVDFYPQGKNIAIEKCLDNLTRYTGRLDLHQYVLQQYAEARNLDIEQTVKLGMKIKDQHDKAWIRKKRLTHPFRRR